MEIQITCPLHLMSLAKKNSTECKVEKILKSSLDSIPSPLVKIQIMGGKVGMRCKGKKNQIQMFTTP